MMNAQPFSTPPCWLPLRLLLGGVLAAALLWLCGTRDWDALLAERFAGLWGRCGGSLIVLVIALLLALCLGLGAGLLARRLGAWAEWCVAFFGRLLACLPVAAVAWAFIGVWIGHFGWPVETLLPVLLPEAPQAWQTTLARTLWEFLAPALLLAVPLTGEIMHCVVTDAGKTVNLDFSLRARGVPRGVWLWRHHLRQLLPLLRARMQSLCLIAPVYLIIVEDVLRFMGWGGWMAQAIRSGQINSVVPGLITGGGMMALLCAALGLLPGKWRARDGLLSAWSWQPWVLWALGGMTLPLDAALHWLLLWLAVLLSSSACWSRAWREISAQLPADAARSLGSTDMEIWRAHIAVVQGRMLAAWMAGVCAQMLLWAAVVHALQPLRVSCYLFTSLCGPLAVRTMQDAAQTLADPAALLEAGAVIALAALCLVQVSRIIQPRPL